MKICPKCNKEFNDEYNICPFCGEKLVIKQVNKPVKPYAYLIPEALSLLSAGYDAYDAIKKYDCYGEYKNHIGQNVLLFGNNQPFFIASSFSPYSNNMQGYDEYRYRDDTFVFGTRDDEDKAISYLNGMIFKYAQQNDLLPNLTEVFNLINFNEADYKKVLDYRANLFKGHNSTIIEAMDFYKMWVLTFISDRKKELKYFTDILNGEYNAASLKALAQNEFDGVRKMYDDYRYSRWSYRSFWPSMFSQDFIDDVIREYWEGIIYGHRDIKGFYSPKWYFKVENGIQDLINQISSINDNKKNVVILSEIHYSLYKAKIVLKYAKAYKEYKDGDYGYVNIYGETERIDFKYIDLLHNSVLMTQVKWDRDEEIALKAVRGEPLTNMVGLSETARRERIKTRIEYYKRLFSE